MLRHPAAIWISSGALIVGYPVVSWIYWPRMLHSGALPPDGDSIVIALFGSIFAVAFLTPLVLLPALFCTRRFNPQTRLLAWRDDRPIKSIFATLILGVPALALIGVALGDMIRPLPWFAHLWTCYALLLAIWLLMLRAALIEQLPPGSLTEL